MAKLIILRGNSGSGKSSVAQALASSSSQKMAIIDADMYRVDMLYPKPVIKDDLGALMKHNVLYCLEHGYDVIWDSIFHANERNRAYLGEILTQLHPADNYIFNFTVSFAETARRHTTRAKQHAFSAELMKTWYLPTEALGYSFEHTIPESYSLEDSIAFVQQTISH